MLVGPLGFQGNLRFQDTGPGRWSGPTEPQEEPAADGGAEQGSWRWRLEFCWGLKEDVGSERTPQPLSHLQPTCPLPCPSHPTLPTSSL